MKLPKELLNELLIFIAISALSFSDLFYLRFLRVFFIFCGINRTIKMNVADGKRNTASDSASALITGLIGVFLSVFGIIIFAYLNGGDSFVNSLPKTFSLGGEPSLTTYSISLLIE